MRGAGQRRLVVVMAGAIAIHLVAMVILDGWSWRGPRRIATAVGGAPVATGNAAALETATVVAIFDGEVTALPLELLTGPADQLGVEGTHPLPAAMEDRPGARAASAGGGELGGRSSVTGRRDRPADRDRRTELWNGGETYRVAGQVGDGTSQSPEALRRDPERAYGDRAVARRGVVGTASASRGGAAGQGTANGAASGAPPREPREAAAAGRDSPARIDGEPRASREDVLAAVGPRAVDAPRSERTVAENAAATTASAETKPAPFDWASLQAGGTAGGVRGPQVATGVLGGGTGRGEAATRATVPRGALDLSMTAERSDPYFRELYRQLDGLVEYPAELRTSLQSGWLVGSFTLAANGAVSQVTIDRRSGHDAFDQALTAALSRLRLPPVPATLLGERKHLKIRVPYTFRNPLIR